MTTPSSRPGLVLTGGGARGAYQAGVLRAVAEVTRARRSADQSPFGFLTGTSAGAINVAFLATRSASFDNATRQLWELWSSLKPDRVFDTRGTQLTLLGLRWLKDLSTGGLLGEARSNHLLDTWPLRKLLEENISQEALRAAIATGAVDGLALTTTHYATGTTVVFHAGAGSDWERTSRVSRNTKLSPLHVLASAAIPLLFPPVEVEGSMYGDGGIRDSAPLSPAIRMGASRVLAIGIRHHRSPGEVADMNQRLVTREVKVADIAGILLNSVFLDGLETDAERCLRINKTVGVMLERGPLPEGFSLRVVPLLLVQPSRDLGAMATNHFRSFPFVLRRLLRGIGASDERGGDLLSYLSFDAAYTLPLLELGYKDGLARADELRAFLTP